MTVHDGNGWTRCGRGHRHWGRHGAAGLLVAAPDRAGQPIVLLQQRSWWGSHGGAWGPPGGARDSHESAVHTALREAAEECAIDPAAVAVHGILQDDHGAWTYRTVLAHAPVPVAAAAVSEETKEVAWVPASDVDLLKLHPGFADQWPALREVLLPLTIIVDAANVMGSRPDGWWRDRAGAARRLSDQLAGLASRGVDTLPDSAPVPSLERWFPRFVVVLEGAAAAGFPDAASPDADTRVGTDTKAGADTGAGADTKAGAGAGAGASAIRIVRASGSGDDEIARLAAATPGPRLVVTADRELRARCEAAGAWVVGPRWLLDLL